MPRVRTEKKKREIIEAASEFFERKGFENTTLEEIAVSLGASKSTLYRYFPSKTDLFGAVVTMDAEVDLVRQRYLRVLEGEGAIRDILTTYGILYLKDILSPDEIRRRRLLIEAARSQQFGEKIIEKGPKQAWEKVTGFMTLRMRSGDLARSDPRKAAMQFLALLRTEHHLWYLEGVRSEPMGEEELKREVDIAVDTFLRAYNPCFQEASG